MKEYDSKKAKIGFGLLVALVTLETTRVSIAVYSQDLHDEMILFILPVSLCLLFPTAFISWNIGFFQRPWHALNKDSTWQMLLLFSVFQECFAVSGIIAGEFTGYDFFFVAVLIPLSHFALLGSAHVYQVGAHGRYPLLDMDPPFLWLVMIGLTPTLFEKQLVRVRRSMAVRKDPTLLGQRSVHMDLFEVLAETVFIALLLSVIKNGVAKIYHPKLNKFGDAPAGDQNKEMFELELDDVALDAKNELSDPT